MCGQYYLKCGRCVHALGTIRCTCGACEEVGSKGRSTSSERGSRGGALASPSPPSMLNPPPHVSIPRKRGLTLCAVLGSACLRSHSLIALDTSGSPRLRTCMRRVGVGWVGRGGVKYGGSGERGEPPMGLGMGGLGRSWRTVQGAWVGKQRGAKRLVQAAAVAAHPWADAGRQQPQFQVGG